MPDLTISLTPSQATRMATAFGKFLGLPGDATVADVKLYLVRQMKEVVRQQEKAVQEAAIIVPSFDPT